jgi:solute carrier family 15 (peptide/histidine transporter), member 3/4
MTDSAPATPLLSCTVTQVEEVKILLRMVPIWFTCIFYSASMCQTTTTFLQQGVLMNTKIGSLSIPAASLSSIEVIFMMIFVVIQDKLIIPFCRRRFQNPSGLTQLQRMGIGRFLVIFCMVAAAILETWRLSSYRDKKSLSILWQLPMYLILACSDVFCGIAQLEFFYGEAPQSMRSLCSAFSFLAISFGYYVNSFVVTFVAAVTKVGGSLGWLPTDLNEGHLDYYFWLWTVISVVNFAVYVALSRKYTHKKVVIQ